MDEEPYYRPQSYLWHVRGSSVSFCDWCDFLEEPQPHAQVWSPSLFPTAPKSPSWRYRWYPHFPCLLASCSWLMAVTRPPPLMCGGAVPWWEKAHAVVPSAPKSSSYLRITPDPAAAPEAVFSASVGSGSWPLCNNLFESPTPSLIGRSRSLWWFDKSKIDEGHFAVMVRLTRNICLIYWHLVPSMGRRICPGMWHI